MKQNTTGPRSIFVFPRADLIASISIAGLLLPEAVAYSSIAGLPPQAGIIALLAGLICYYLVGNSRFAIVSATSSSAAVLAATIATLSNGDPALRAALAVGMVLMTGLFFLLASVARLGSVTDFIAKPVLRGFAFGLALVIIIKQLAAIADIKPVYKDIPRFTYVLFSEISQWNKVGVIIAATTLLFLYLTSKWRKAPGGLFVIALGIAAEKLLDLSQYGIELVGTVNLQLSWPSLPNLLLADWLRLGELGLAMVMILYAESYGSIRSYAIKHGDSVQPNRDLLALGISNMVSGLFQGMPVGAGYSGTAANEAAGANSKLSGAISALIILLIILIFLPAIALTPEPVLAAIVIYAVSHALKPAVFRPYFIWQRDRFVVIIAICGVLLLGVLDGLLVAIGMSILLMLKRFASSTVSILGRLGNSHDFVNITIHPEAHKISGLLILRPDQPLFFANVERILNQARYIVTTTTEPLQSVILSLEESPDLDSSSLEALLEFIATLQKEGCNIIVARLKPAAYSILKHALPATTLVTLSDLSVDNAVNTALALKTNFHISPP